MISIVGNIIQGVFITDFVAALKAAVILSLVSWLFNLSVKKEKGRRVVYVNRGDHIDMKRGRDGSYF
jgi:hypothetical protein